MGNYHSNSLAVSFQYEEYTTQYLQFAFNLKKKKGHFSDLATSPSAGQKHLLHLADHQVCTHPTIPFPVAKIQRRITSSFALTAHSKYAVKTAALCFHSVMGANVSSCRVLFGCPGHWTANVHLTGLFCVAILDCHWFVFMGSSFFITQHITWMVNAGSRIVTVMCTRQACRIVTVKQYNISLHFFSYWHSF